MFHFFLRARADQFFHARSIERDAENDRSRVSSITRLVESSLASARTERAGLMRRLDDARTRAVALSGNAPDEYLTREAADNRLLDQCEAEILKGQRRLDQLTDNIAHLQFIRAALLTRFPISNHESAHQTAGPERRA